MDLSQEKLKQMYDAQQTEIGQTYERKKNLLLSCAVKGLKCHLMKLGA